MIANSPVYVKSATKLKRPVNTYIVLDCPFVEAFWMKLGFLAVPLSSDERITNVQRPDNFPKQVFSTFIALGY
jgi:hypothetical protein